MSLSNLNLTQGEAYFKQVGIHAQDLWAFHVARGFLFWRARNDDLLQLEMGPSASADSINRTTTIHGSSRGHRTRNRPSHQPDSGSYDTAGRIANVLAVHHGTGRFTDCDHATDDH